VNPIPRVFSFDTGEPGGVQSYSRNLVRAFRESCACSAFALSLNNSPHNKQIKILRGKLLDQTHDEAVTIEQLIDRCAFHSSDLVILHDASTMEFFRKGRFRAHVWIVLHGDYGYYYNTATRYSLWADCTLTVTQGLCEKVASELTKRVTPTFLPPLVFAPNPPNLELKKPQAIFIGRETPEKGAHLLEMIDHHLMERGIFIDWIVISAGDHDPQIRKTIYKWMKQTHRVQILHDLPNEALFSYLESSMFFILPSTAEGFPVSMIEGFSQGCIPLLFPFHKDVKDLLPKEFEENIIYTKTPEGIARRVAELLEKPQLEMAFLASRQHFESLHLSGIHRLLSITPFHKKARLKSPWTFLRSRLRQKLRVTTRKTHRRSKG